MRFRLGFVTGMATGYYLGARAGRQRYDQMNRALAKLRRSDAFDDVRDMAKSVVEEGVDKARSVVESRAGDSGENGQSADTAGDAEGPSGLILPGPGGATGITDPPMGPGGYSSSR